jgi:glycosyltransferase involved in cell wall biosynthesis
VNFMDNSKTLISFIIPAFNEEKHIGNVIKSIQQIETPFKYEIIVVDHNSSDDTALIADKMSVKVIKKIGGSIASVRNLGVKSSKGEILVFLDADVTLTLKWFQNIENTINELKENIFIVTGSHCNVPENGNWIEKFWFQNYVEEKKTTNLGTGHMIINRKFFDQIGGFDESLSTGEDYDICMKAIKHSGKIKSNSLLRVIHHDYPNNLFQFIKREVWHGKGDVVSLKNILKSKVAVAALMFLALHIFAFITLFLHGLPQYFYTLPMIGVVTLVLLSSIKKYSHCNFKVIIINTLIFYFYYWGRVGSFFDPK